MKIVIDASVAAAWSFEDEESPATERVAELVETFGAWVPNLFPTEIANVLLIAERRRRILPSQVDSQIQLLSALGLTIDLDSNLHAWNETFSLARDERLTVYDATYLELALRLGAHLATLDVDLAAAARRRGLTVLP